MDVGADADGWALACAGKKNGTGTQLEWEEIYPILTAIYGLRPSEIRELTLKQLKVYIDRIPQMRFINHPECKLGENIEEEAERQSVLEAAGVSEAI